FVPLPDLLAVGNGNFKAHDDWLASTSFKSSKAAVSLSRCVSARIHPQLRLCGGFSRSKFHVLTSEEPPQEQEHLHIGLPLTRPAYPMTVRRPKVRPFKTCFKRPGLPRGMSVLLCISCPYRARIGVISGQQSE